MSELRLVNPTEAYAKQIWDYRAEFLNRSDDLAGCAGLKEVANVAEWLANLKKNSCEETVTEGLVPATTYLAIRNADRQIVGMIDIRHRLNDFLLKSGGHIGYSVHPAERRKGYAKEMVRLALIKCREELALSKVLITCDKANIASAKTIQANGGILENEIPENDRMTQRYWVAV
ncbi:MAG: GNAT family N-acetyltransferase [Turicibacter sp.]|nr:GNAT family N-acetyltransferase [Turicibacter sp.]